MRPDMINLPIPLRENSCAWIDVPEDLTEDEAGKIAGFIIAWSKTNAANEKAEEKA